MDEQSYRRDWGSLAFCVALSLLLHGGLLWALEFLPRETSSQPPSRPSATRHVQMVRATPKKKPSPQEQKEPEAAFAKTSADAPQRRPQQVDFIGKHDSRASGGPDAPQRTSDAPLPTMAGRENEEETVTFNQERQDGDLAHEGKQPATPPALPATARDATPTPPQELAAQGSPDGTPEQGDTQGEGAEPTQPATEASASRDTTSPTEKEGMTLNDLRAEDALTLSPPSPPPARLGQPDGAEGRSAAISPRSHRNVQLYDPSLADNMQQPGLRTHERRTRSTGRFVFGRRPALNVAATARGRYEAEIYRRIARIWYAACDDHRGDIIPGSITVSLRLAKSGRIDSMDLVRRRGASVIQQSFSFGAIRRAALPPMPDEVQQGVIGQLYEMILTFNFD